jgi:hypothetical protein
MRILRTLWEEGWFGWGILLTSNAALLAFGINKHHFFGWGA